MGCQQCLRSMAGRRRAPPASQCQRRQKAALGSGAPHLRQQAGNAQSSTSIITRAGCLRFFIGQFRVAAGHRLIGPSISPAANFSGKTRIYRLPAGASDPQLRTGALTSGDLREAVRAKSLSGAADGIGAPSSIIGPRAVRRERHEVSIECSTAWHRAGSITGCGRPARPGPIRPHFCRACACTPVAHSESP